MSHKHEREEGDAVTLVKFNLIAQTALTVNATLQGDKFTLRDGNKYLSTMLIIPCHIFLHESPALNF